MAKGITRKISTIGSQISAIISVALVLLIIGIVITTAIVTGDAGSDMRRHMGMVVKMYPDASDDEVAILRQILETTKHIRSVQYTSAEDVLAEERSYNGELLALIGSNPYSAEFEIFLQPDYQNSDSIYLLSSQLEMLPVVEEVYSQPDVVDNINEFMSGVSVFLVILGIILLVISVALIYNTVGMSVYARRFVINTMKLVGATDNYIRKPFIISATITGSVAAVIAFLLLCALRAYSSTLNNDVLFVVSTGEFAMIFGVLLVLGIALCIGSVYLATRRYIKASFDELFV